jgi:hypothetical protein
MLSLQSSLVADHQAQLRSEAASGRIVRAAAESHEPHLPVIGGIGPSAPRRTLADLAVRVSIVAADAARRLDPAVEECFGTRSTPALGR